MSAENIVPKKKKRKHAVGLPPGTLTVDPAAAPTHAHVIAYGPADFHEENLTDLAPLAGLLNRFPVVWLNVDGLKDVAFIGEIGKRLNLHPLALEDAVNVYQRAKADMFPDFEFIVARMVNTPPRLVTEQFSIFLGKRFVVTFQEEPGDCFDPLRERIRKGQGVLRQQGTDYLAYALLDGIVDSYYPILESYGEKLEALEDQSLNSITTAHIRELHAVKRQLFQIRRAAWPMRDMMASLVRETSPFIGQEARLHLRDCYDHVAQVMDLLETYRELSADLIDLQLAGVNTRMNEVMRVLTIIATLFIPMTFIASIYGMNFKYMPELEWVHGYSYALGIMGALAVVLLTWFWRKGWLKSFVPQTRFRDKIDSSKHD